MAEPAEDAPDPYTQPDSDSEEGAEGSDPKTATEDAVDTQQESGDTGSDSEAEPTLAIPEPTPDSGNEPGELAFAQAFAKEPREEGPETATERWRKESPTARLKRGDLAAVLQAPFLRPILRFPLRKAVIWFTILALIYFSRAYFGVIFLTFVITYISLTIVGRLAPFFKSRKIPVLIVYAHIVGAVVGLGFATVPVAVKQGKVQLDKLREVEDIRAVINQKATALVDNIPVLKDWGIVEKLRDPEVNQQVVDQLREFQGNVVKTVGWIIGSAWKAVLNISLALIFSFMLVWDMPKIGKSIALLGKSRLSGVWFEVAPSVATFFRLLGRAFEAQTVIAIVNTALTSIGLVFLGFDGIGVLALVVFLCSFIPILGVWLSTVPICFVALQSGGGFGLVAGVLVMVSVVHFVEAYMLNPRIYGHHMRLHPLTVLVVLYLAGESLGVWGLIVAVPLTTYVWRHLVMGEAQAIHDPEDELEPAAVGPQTAP